MPNVVRLTDLPTDIKALAELARGEGFRFLDRLVREFNSGANTFTGQGEGLYGVLDGKRLVGVGGLSIDPYTDEQGVGRLRRLYVHPHYRDRGVGAALAKRLEQQGAETFGAIRLFTDSPRAARFYERLGYTRRAARHVSHLKQLR